eukprot:TRINITY_DN4806_c0_g1_i5.p1 TRINITY_DN4806_c0_g1~~TRINITY_DN4806_c0_g1_i5.p1  ORF type:complete len:128 (+),score=15.96 TRINITY_DN4806_c0_g1_i5:3-386(+)
MSFKLRSSIQPTDLSRIDSIVGGSSNLANSPRKTQTGSSSAASKPRPPSELHLKMSKKIAQLTKVIYQLNTKNEDHEVELKGLADAYEHEIDEILRDAYKKINSFREQLETSRDSQRVKQALEVSWI